MKQKGAPDRKKLSGRLFCLQGKEENYDKDRIGTNCESEKMNMKKKKQYYKVAALSLAAAFSLATAFFVTAGDQILCPPEVFAEGFDLEYEMGKEKESLRFYKETDTDTDYEALGQPGESIVRMYYRIQENVVNGFNCMVEYFIGK